MGNKKNTHTVLYPIVRSVLNVIFYKGFKLHVEGQENCLLYTSDAADEL